jgi:hypothetical protein
MKMYFQSLLLTLLLSFVVACSNQDINAYKANKPEFDMRHFFNGSLEAHGIVKDFGGEVIRTFQADLTATWQQDQLTLDEQFIFDDGERQTRIWQITATQLGQYRGTASDVIGEAIGESAGNALHWRYTMDLQVDEDTYRVDFDDWIYQVSENVVINQTDINKWGMKVGEVVLVITKVAND